MIVYLQLRDVSTALCPNIECINRIMHLLRLRDTIEQLGLKVRVI